MCPAASLFSLDNLLKWWATLEHQRATYRLAALTNVSRRFEVLDTGRQENRGEPKLSSCRSARHDLYKGHGKGTIPGR